MAELGGVLVPAEHLGPHGFGFCNLENIRPVRPAEPPAEDEVPAARGAGVKGVSISRPRSSSPVKEVSRSFQMLIDQLIQQHITELGATRSERFERSSERRRTEESSVFTDPRSDKTLDLEMCSGNSENMASTGLPAAPHLLKMKSTVNDVMSQQKRALPELHASQILEAWEEHSGPGSSEKDGGLPFESGADMAILLLETPSEYLERYRKMTRLEKMELALQSNFYEMLMAVLLCINMMWMALEIQISGSMSGADLGIFQSGLIAESDMKAYEDWLHAGEVAFTLIFATDVLVRVCILRSKFWKVWLNYIDVAISVTNIFEAAIAMYSSSTALPFPPVLFRLLRLGKLARAIRVVSMTSVLASLQLLVKCLGSSRDMLFWSFCLLTFVQCVAGMILSTLTIDFIKDESKSADVRSAVFLYYGTFSRTTLSMFEILFANWSPCCRILVENVSEWFSVFFLLYRCVLGFAILNVVNSVFVQQTMKTASSDEELAFKQKQRDADLYTKKVRKLFQTMDSSGDGAINLEEFAKLVQSPKLRFWMSQLELEYHDLLSLFEFLDNGDGQITLLGDISSFDLRP
ncbi:SCN11A [Symbiodinium natans]|uniref:SCN11A protein n=1 Tax=Symbiodinium natans TaxID=878477 RepID=A0A812PTJ9_9DINO|nr:SCN11A [Symbiodinium natans]